MTVPYPSQSYPDDPLEIPVDPMTNIEMEVYHPNLVTHQSVSGMPFYLRRGEPRWRGTVRWAACYTGSERAGAIEGYLASLTEGISISTLKHGREPIDAPAMNKPVSGSGPGRATIATVRPPAPGPVPEYYASWDPISRRIESGGVRMGRKVNPFYYFTRQYNGVRIEYEYWTERQTLERLGTRIGSAFGTPRETRQVVRYTNQGVAVYETVYYGFPGNLPTNAGFVRMKTASSGWGRFFEARATNIFYDRGTSGYYSGGDNPIRTYRMFRTAPTLLPQQFDETTSQHKPGQIFKLSTGDHSKRIFMVTRVANDTEIFFTPEIDIFGTASTMPLDATDANQYLTVRGTPGSTIPLPWNRVLSGPWSMSWVEGV